MNADTPGWQDQEGVLASAREFAGSGSRLVSLTFPRTEIRLYGDVAILYTTYSFELEKDGQRRTHAGRGTEVFVRRGGVWVNPTSTRCSSAQGWYHTISIRSSEAPLCRRQWNVTSTSPEVQPSG